MTIEIESLTKRFGEQAVVADVSLSVRDRELFVLLGSSGSGKSTVLRLIAGLLKPDQGTVTLRGTDVTALPPQRRGVGFVFQSYALFKHLTVADNIEFGLKVRGIAAVERSARTEELLELVGLGGFGRRYPSQLSGGQCQRVALARALAYKPSVLLLDEPFGALDVKIRGRLRRSLKELQTQLGITTILVTHDQDEAFELADRIGVMERGRIVEVGTPRGLYFTPKTEFTANFVGAGNVLFGRFSSGVINVGNASLELPPEAPVHSEGAPVRILFRPEWVEFSLPDAPVRAGTVKLGVGTLRDRMFGGASERLRFELDDLRGSQSVRQVSEYSPAATTIDALMNASTEDPAPAVGDRRSIILSRYHILQPSSLRILVLVSDQASSPQVLDTASSLAAASHGLVALLGTIPGKESNQAAEQLVAKAAERVAGATRDARLVTKVRRGSDTREVVLEAQEGHYDLVILARGSASAPLSDVARLVLATAKIPVLVVSHLPSAFKRMLICTAAGEPGINDVRFAARLARHTGAFARVFHVRAPGGSIAEQSRTDRYVERARSILSSFGVSGDAMITEGGPQDAISRQLAGEQWDLLVLGAPPPSYLLEAGEAGLPLQLLDETRLAVLIVPTLE